MAEKKCTKCGAIKPLDQFPKMSCAKDGLRPRCKPCHTKDSQAWADANHERYLTRLRAWYDKNERRPRALLTQEEKKRRKRASNAIWAAKNKDRFDQIRREWAKKNPHIQAEIVRRRQVAKQKATPSWVDRSAIQAFYKQAKELSLATGKKWCVDHIVPIKSKLVCGLHVEHNLQLMEFGENVRKGNRHWPDMP